MSILMLSEDFVWSLDYQVKPVEFWPYTTLVRDVILEAPREYFRTLQTDLIDMFNKAGITTFPENKSAFGIEDDCARLWYIGFKDSTFLLGTRVEPDEGIKPFRVTKEPEKK